MSHSEVVQCLISGALAGSWSIVAPILEMEDAAVGVVTVWARESSCRFWHGNLSSLSLDCWLLWKEEVWRRNAEEPSLWLSTEEVKMASLSSWWHSHSDWMLKDSNASVKQS